LIRSVQCLKATPSVIFVLCRSGAFTMGTVAAAQLLTAHLPRRNSFGLCCADASAAPRLMSEKPPIDEDSLWVNRQDHPRRAVLSICPATPFCGGSCGAVRGFIGQRPVEIRRQPRL